MRWPRGRRPPLPSPPANRVLLISASMGAGHDGAARSLAAQLEEEGYHAEVRDFLDSGPLRIGSALRSGYEFELKHVPSAYDATYRLWYKVSWLCPLVAWIVTALTGRRVLRWIAQLQPDVVVSTYPLATLCLGRLRDKRRLHIPAVNFITDFGVHPLWVHRGIDLNLAVHDAPAQMAARRTGRPAVACGPVVSSSLEPGRLPDRIESRRAVGLDPDHKAVLVVAGSWGVGDVEATWAAITASGRFTPVVVCGRDPHLLDRVKALASRYPGHSIVLGWTDEMPRLLAACDVLVENAGGLTSLEAMRAGLPVISFHPIAGHGKENTAAMAAAGVSTLAGDEAELDRALTTLTAAGKARDAQVAQATSMFRSRPARLVVSARPVVSPPRHSPAVVAVRVAAVAAAVVSMLWVGLTSGVAVATEAGAGVAHPAPDISGVTYIGVRLDRAELTTRAIVSDLSRMHMSAVVDGSTASADPTSVRLLVEQGINVENGGWGEPPRPGGDHDLPWSRAQVDADAGRRLGILIDRPVTFSVPGRRVTAWDLVDSRDAHMSIVVPNHVLDPERIGSASYVRLEQRNIYVINGMASTPSQLEATLAAVNRELQEEHLISVSLATLT